MRLLAILALLWSATVLASEDPLEGLAKRLFQEILNDADSAKFIELQRNEKCIWGKLNAKNKYGAYVGFTKFTISIPSNDDRPKYVETGPGSFAYLEMCVSRLAAYESCMREDSGVSDKSFCVRYKD